MCEGVRSENVRCEGVKVCILAYLQLTMLEKSSKKLEDEKRELMANLNVS